MPHLYLVVVCLTSIWWLCASPLSGCCVPHLYLVVAVVVEVDDAVDLAVGRHDDVLWPADALSQRLTSILLHLDVVELPANTSYCTMIKTVLKLQMKTKLQFHD